MFGDIPPLKLTNIGPNAPKGNNRIPTRCEMVSFREGTGPKIDIEPETDGLEDD